MEKILYIADTDSTGMLSRASLEGLAFAVDFAKNAGTSFSVALIGEHVQKAADSIASCGAEKFIAAEGPAFKDPRYSSDTAAISELFKASGCGFAVCPGTSRFNRAAPGAACRLGGKIDTHVGKAGVEAGAVTIQRWYYRQRISATLSRSQRPWFMVVDPGTVKAWSGTAGSAKLETIAVNLPANLENTHVVGIESASSGAQTIRPEADILFVAGAGWTKKQADGAAHLEEAKNHILTFLDKCKASLGSSKSLVDLKSEGGETLSFMSHLNQVGQTGATPRHPKGLAACCHGEEPHVVGWRFINERRAINKDPNCGWSQGKADVLYVADAFEVMTELNKIL